MEKNIVIIELDKYEKIIEENKDKENKIAYLEKEYAKLKTETNTLYEEISRRIYNENNYYLCKLIEDREMTYYRKQIISDYNEYCIYNIDYINEQIDIMIERKKEEQEEPIPKEEKEN